MDAGEILLGKYRVDEVLGTGGMGRVVKASHLYLQQPVAIKVLLPHMAESAETVSRFLREAQATSRLKSEHICRVMDVGTMTDGVPFMVMEYLDGNDLNQILRHHGPQAPQIVCDLMLQACEGMAEAHSIGIVHRDIKPSNFFITRRPDGSMLLKILDFGISKTPVGVTELTGTQTVIGTPTYMAPEQMKQAKSADARSDIWSMGIVMYQLLVGRPPFVGESYAELVIKVGGEPPDPIMVPLPPGLGEVVFRCLEKVQSVRQQNVGELARMLAPFASDPVSAAQSAARATRILQQKTIGNNMLPLAAGGGRLAPVPISPAQLTPRSWPPHASPTSTHGRGQVTHRVRGGRGWLVAGLGALVVAAGAGGYAISQMRQPDVVDAAATTAAPPPSAASATAEPAKPDAEPPPEVKREPTIVKANVEPVKADAKSAVKADAKSVVKAAAKPVVKADAKPVAKPAAKADVKPAVKADAKTVTADAKPATDDTKLVKTKTEPRPAVKATTKPVAKPAAKPTKPAKPKSDDLFDTRH